MAKISTYPSADVPLQLSDRLIGTEAFRPVPSPTPLATKNFSLGELLQLFSSNFPAANLQAVLNAGNTATQNITLTGTISATLIKPINIEDTSGSQGLTFQVLSKGTSSINWVDIPVDNLQAVLNAGNTATQNITLVGDITSTKIIPGNIQDETGTIGTAGKVLSKTATGIQWINNPTPLTPGLADVTSVGNVTMLDIYANSFYTNTGYALMDDGVLLGESFQFVNSSNSYLYSISNNFNTWGLPDKSGTIALLSDILPQGLTSVGLSMPVAFNVANSPLTSDGTIAVTGAGTAAQYIRGDGQLATFPSTAGGGSSVNYYLNGSIPSGVAGYQQMDNEAIIGGGTDFTLVGNGLIAQFLTDIGNPNRTEIPGGAWNFEMFFQSSSAGGNQKFYIELLKYDGTTFTSITSSILVPEEITGGTAIDLYLTSLAVPTTPLLVTDRLAIRVYITDNAVGRTITLHTENTTLCEIITTFSGGVTSLNGLTANTQYLAVGTTGTDFNISSLTDTHTFNLPTASATNRGALSSADWTTFNAKFTLPALTNGSVLFSNGTTIAENNTNFYWDNTANTLILNKPSIQGNSLTANGIIAAGAISLVPANNTISIGGITAATTSGSGILYGSSQNFLHLRTASITRLYINNLGNVGIGTTAPTAKLHIAAQGALSTDIALRVRNSADTADLMTVAGNGNTLLNSSTLISTSTYPLQVVGGAGGSALFSNSLRTQALNINLTTVGETRIYSDYFGAGVDQKIILGTFANRANQLVLNTNGNVLINTTTDNGGKLQIKAAGALSTDIALRVRNSADTGDLATIGGTGILTVGGVGNDGAINLARGSNGGIMGAIIQNSTHTQIHNYQGNGIDLYVAAASNLQRAFIRSTGVGISGTAGGTFTLDASALLQANSTTQGFLPPRMTNAQRIAIATPAVGLCVYCTDAVEGLYINKSTGWTYIG